MRRSSDGSAGVQTDSDLDQACSRKKRSGDIFSEAIATDCSEFFFRLVVD